MDNKVILKAKGDSATRTVTEILDPSCELKVGDSVNDFSSNKDYLDDVYNGKFVIISTRRIKSANLFAPTTPCNVMLDNGKVAPAGCEFEVNYDRNEQGEYVLGIEVKGLGKGSIRFDSEAEAKKDGWIVSRAIKSAVDGGWEVRSSDVPEALDLFVEYFGEETALEEIAKAMGDYTLRENLEWIAQQFGIAEDLEDSDTWDIYDEMLEVMGVSELFTNLTQAAGYDELAEDLAFIFRQYDFREWDKYD